MEPGGIYADKEDDKPKQTGRSVWVLGGMP